nr:thiamine pyrophosphate-binding protein [Corynebacterium xerosis]
MTALAEAKAARVPMVYVTGSAPAAGPRHFDLNQAGLLDALGIDHFTPTPATAAADAHAAFALAQTHQEPVVLLLPFDLQTAPLADGGDVLSRPELLRPAHATPTRPLSEATRAELAAVADALARRPPPASSLSGRGVVRAGVAADAPPSATASARSTCIRRWPATSSAASGAWAPPAASRTAPTCPSRATPTSSWSSAPASTPSSPAAGRCSRPMRPSST